MVSLNALLITGTDTEVGKTVVTSILLAYWQNYFPLRSIGVLKPVQSGEGDREFYQQVFFPALPLEAINPQYFEAPLAPPLAADLENQTVDLATVWQTLEGMTQRHDWVLVEGAGGLGSPVTHDMTVADLAGAWHLPVVLVVPVKLGCIAQAVANVALARQNQLDLRGIILNCQQPLTADQIQQWAPVDLITNLTQTPVLGTVPFLEDAKSIESLAAAAVPLSLELLYPLPPTLVS
jgi:dethiobiotin synthetase